MRQPKQQSDDGGRPNHRAAHIVLHAGGDFPDKNWPAGKANYDAFPLRFCWPGLQLGYEARCAKPHAFDVMLGSQLGVGAYRALVEKRLDGVMVSVARQFDLNYVPFSTLIDPQTLVTKVRYVEPKSDFHRLARFLETYVNE